MIIYQETFFVFNLYVFFHLPNPWLLMYGVLRSEQSLVGFYFPSHVNQVLGSNIALIILQPDPRPFPQRNQIRWAGPREMQSASNQKTAIETRLNREAAFLVRIKPWLKSCLITSNNYSILCSLFWSWSKLLKCIKEKGWRRSLWSTYKWQDGVVPDGTPLSLFSGALGWGWPSVLLKSALLPPSPCNAIEQERAVF
jgi:hypothetical protein